VVEIIRLGWAGRYNDWWYHEYPSNKESVMDERTARKEGAMGKQAWMLDETYVRSAGLLAQRPRDILFPTVRASPSIS
jgi:hypothetical protein